MAAHSTPTLVSPDLFGGIPGLIWAYRFASDGKAIPLAFPVDPAILSDRPAGGDWLWLHFTRSDARLTHVVEQLPLPLRAQQILLAHDDHICLHLEGDTAFGVVADWHHAIEDEIAACTREESGDDFNESHGIGRLHFAVTDGLVVSTRLRPLHSVQRVRERLAEGACVESPQQVLESILDQFGASVARVSRGLVDDLDGIEDRVLSERSGDERRDLGRLRRRAVRMHRPLNALRRVIDQFERRHERRSGNALLVVAARLLQRFDALDADLIELQERARVLQDEVAAKLTDRTNRQLYLLSILSALFLPPTLIVGVFGMNTKGLPLTEDADGFWIAIGLCVMASVVVYGALRRLGVR